MRDITILGSGPAGPTAAIYAARATLKPLVVEGLSAGGQLMITSDVENYPGFPKGIFGPELMVEFRQQAERFGTEFLVGDATRVELNRSPILIHIDNQTIETRTLVLATGASAKWLGLESETALYGRGVSACATCDGFFFNNQDVLVVGGGDTAMEEAIYLARMVKQVTVVHRRDQLRGSKIMQERALQEPEDPLPLGHASSRRSSIRASKGMTGPVVRNLKTSGQKQPTDGVFVAIGHPPNSKLFQGLIETHERRLPPLPPGSTRTSIPGVFACGDVQDTTTGRPSPRPAPAAWRPSTPSAGSRSREVIRLPEMAQGSPGGLVSQRRGWAPGRFSTRRSDPVLWLYFKGGEWPSSAEPAGNRSLGGQGDVPGPSHRRSSVARGLPVPTVSTVRVGKRASSLGREKAAMSTPAATSYAVTDLGLFPGGSSSLARGINAAGWVVGTADTAGGEFHAFLFHDGLLQDLGTLGGRTSLATALSGSGQVIGQAERADGALHAFFWAAGRMTDLGALGGRNSALHSFARGATDGALPGVGSAETPRGVHACSTPTARSSTWTCRWAAAAALPPE